MLPIWISSTRSSSGDLPLYSFIALMEMSFTDGALALPWVPAAPVSCSFVGRYCAFLLPCICCWGPNTPPAAPPNAPPADWAPKPPPALWEPNPPVGEDAPKLLLCPPNAGPPKAGELLPPNGEGRCCCCCCAELPKTLPPPPKGEGEGLEAKAGDCWLPKVGVWALPKPALVLPKAEEDWPKAPKTL